MDCHATCLMAFQVTDEKYYLWGFYLHPIPLIFEPFVGIESGSISNDYSVP